jgi:hypothetical protein
MRGEIWIHQEHKIYKYYFNLEAPDPKIRSSFFGKINFVYLMYKKIRVGSSEAEQEFVKFKVEIS